MVRTSLRTAAESDDAREVMDAACGGVGPVEGRPGGGRASGRGAMRATMRLATVPPRDLDIALSDSAVTVRYGQRDIWTPPLGKTGSVTETFMPSVDGARLIVVVESVAGGRGAVEFRRVYDARLPH